jgi:hypothetical protein
MRAAEHDALRPVADRDRQADARAQAVDRRRPEPLTASMPPGVCAAQRSIASARRPARSRAVCASKTPAALKAASSPTL